MKRNTSTKRLLNYFELNVVSKRNTPITRVIQYNLYNVYRCLTFLRSVKLCSTDTKKLQSTLNFHPRRRLTCLADVEMLSKQGFDPNFLDLHTAGRFSPWEKNPDFRGKELTISFRRIRLNIGPIAQFEPLTSIMAGNSSVDRRHCCTRQFLSVASCKNRFLKIAIAHSPLKQFSNRNGLV